MVDKISATTAKFSSQASLSADNSGDASAISVFPLKEGSTEKTTKEQALLNAKGQALGDLMGSLDVNCQGKPVVHEFDDILQACVKKLQGIVNTYMDKAGKLMMESASLDPKSADYKQKIQEIEQQIKQLKTEAKSNLDNINCVIVAMEETSAVLFAEYGKDKANGIPMDQIKTVLSSMLNSSGSANPKEVKKTVDDLIKKFKETQKNGGKKDGGAEAPSSSPPQTKTPKQFQLKADKVDLA